MDLESGCTSALSRCPSPYSVTRSDTRPFETVALSIVVSISHRWPLEIEELNGRNLWTAPQ